MALLVANGSGTYNTAATWDTVANTPTFHATTTISITAAGLFGLTYTAPNLVNKATGALFFITGKPASGVYTATLYENAIATAAVGTVTFSDINANVNHWVYIRFTTPYTYTTLTAGAYKVQLKAGSTTGSVAANSAGTAIAFMATDDRHAVPTVGDNIWITALNAVTATTVTVNTTGNLCGDGSDIQTSVVAIPRSFGNAVTLAGGAVAKGTLTFDATVNTDLTPRGNVQIQPGGSYEQGTLATPIGAGLTSKLLWDQNGTPGNYGFDARTGGRVYRYGQPLTTWRAHVASGTGIAADPLITDVNHTWNVGDEVLITASSANATAYQETETRFVIAVPAANQLVLSNTSGGVEAALTFTHDTNAWVLNLTRNSVFTSTNTAMGWCGNNTINVVGDFACAYVRDEYPGTNLNTGGINVKQSMWYTNAATAICSLDYSVMYKPSVRGWRFSGSSRIAATYTGNICCLQNGTTVVDVFLIEGSGNKIYNDWYIVGNVRGGIQLSASSLPNTFNNCYIIANNSAGGTGTGMILISNAVAKFVGCDIQANRVNAFILNGSNSASAINCTIGNRMTNTIDVVCGSSLISTMLFSNCLMGSATLISNYLNMADNSLIAFHRLNQTDNNHTWYTNYGSARSTGAGLVDTTVRTAGSLGLRLAPENATTGFTWTTKILANPAAFAAVFGFMQKNAAFGTDVVKIEIFLPGNDITTGTADATYTMPNDTNWDPFSLSAYNANTTSDYATVRFTAASSTAGAYVYLDDLFNGKNGLTAFDLWSNGQPSVVMFPDYYDPAAVWNIATNGLTNIGTTGLKLIQLATKGDIAAQD